MATEEEQTVIFCAEFTEGYSFKGLIDYLKQTNTMGPFIFTPRSIEYYQTDAKNTILNVLEIKGSKLTLYKFNYQDPIAYGISLSDFKNTISTINKKDGIRLISFLGNPHILIQHLSQGNTENNQQKIGLVKIQPINATRIVPGTYQRKKEDPDCTVKVSDFCKTCAALVKLKCEYISITRDKRSIKFNAIMPGETAGVTHEFRSNNPFPEEDDNKSIQFDKLKRYFASLIVGDDASNNGTIQTRTDEYETYSIRVETNYIKALSKLTNTFKEGTVKMYMESGLPFKLVFSNSFCKLQVYLNNVSK